VLLLEVLEHIPFVKTFTVLQSVKNLLNKDGRFIISVPVYEDLEQKIREGRNFSHHVRRYTPEILRAELEIAGFIVEKVVTLYAFSSWYRVKSAIARLTGVRKPNVVIMSCRQD